MAGLRRRAAPLRGNLIGGSRELAEAAAVQQIVLLPPSPCDSLVARQVWFAQGWLMKHRVAIAGLTLIACCSLAPQPASAADRARAPLHLTFVAPATHAARTAAQPREAAPSMARNGRLVASRDQLPLRERALQSVLAGSEIADEEPDIAGSAENRFRFEKNGNFARDLSRGYREMCAKVSNRLWDEPNGRRVKFDIAGKPGVAVEIPLR